MDKKTFMKELERSLAVLQEDELRDIVSEYEQHIDMKVKNGLSEEEAIADFGSIAELSAEILEVYHVRADYVRGPETKHGWKWILSQGKEEGAEKREGFLHQAGETCAAAGKDTADRIQKAGGYLRDGLNWLVRQIKRPFLWIGRQWIHLRGGHQKEDFKSDDVLTCTVRSKKNDWNAGICQRVVSVIGSFIKCSFWFCIKAVFWGIRMCWNACWIGFSLLCGGMGLFCLFGLGVLAVLWMQGYPLAGVTIGCLGLNLCMFAAAGMGLTFFWRKHETHCDNQSGEALRQEFQEQDGQEEGQHA